MICSNTIEEYNKKRQCWFPRDPSSPYPLCKRCTFYKGEELLHRIAKGDFTEIPPNLLIEENHFDALSFALVSLQKAKHPSFSSLYINSYEQYLLRQVYRHTHCSRCPLYQYCLSKQDRKDAHIVSLPWNCWQCMAWILRQQNLPGFYQAFTRGILSLQTCKPIKNANSTDLIDCMISLELKGKGHTARLLFDHYRRWIGNEEREKELLETFHFQPAMISTVFKDSYTEYFPSAWKVPNYKESLQKRALQFVRKRNWVFKEELIMRTWAPHRLFPWCLDIQELADFPES